MKSFIAPLALAGMLASSLYAQDAKTNAVSGTNAVSAAEPVKITAAEAKEHLKAQAIVTGKVAEVSQTEKLIRINLDQPYPKQAMTAIIFGAKTNDFSGLDKLKDKTVEISGKIAEFHGHPEIILNSPKQLKVLPEASVPVQTPGK